MIAYRLRVDKIYDDDGFLHTVYGVDALNEEKYISSIGFKVQRFSQSSRIIFNLLLHQSPQSFVC